MKVNQWTIGLAAAGLVTLAPAVLAQSAPAAAPAPATPPTPSLLTALSATTISGYVDTSAVWNPGTGNANPAPYAFNAGKQDGFNLDSVVINIAKPQDETGWSAGYDVELSYGPDAIGTDGSDYPVRQAYVAMHMPLGNGIDWELGRWDNLLGYESNDSYKNPNFTRSYGYSIEPTDHTGLNATYKFSDAIALELGAVDTVTTEPFGGFNARSGPGNTVVESKKGIVSLLTLTAPSSWGFLGGSTLAAGFDHGQGAYTHDKTEWYVGVTLNTPITNLTFGASFDAVDHFDIAIPADVDVGYVESFAGYGSFKLTDKATLNGRIEYANGSLGALSLADNGVFEPGFNKVIAVTGTLQYALWANVTSRLELRWDHAADGSSPFGGTVAGLPGDKKNEVMLAANVIYQF
jgi:hypothetical protein